MGLVDTVDAETDNISTVFVLEKNTLALAGVFARKAGGLQGGGAVLAILRYNSVTYEKLYI